ncbi:MAG: AsnC family transcriptional regulator [Methanocellales archaeon]
MDKIDRVILSILQIELPLVEKPFKAIGERIGIEEEEVIERVKRLHKSGKIRQFRPIINPKKLGLKTTLVAMRVPEDKIEKVAEIIDSYEGVSHNYVRRHYYNIWFTLAARDEKSLKQTVEEIKKRTGIKEVLNLPAKKLFKLEVKFDL